MSNMAIAALQVKRARAEPSPSETRVSPTLASVWATASVSVWFSRKTIVSPAEALVYACASVARGASRRRPPSRPVAVAASTPPGPTYHVVPNETAGAAVANEWPVVPPRPFGRVIGWPKGSSWNYPRPGPPQEEATPAGETFYADGVPSKIAVSFELLTPKFWNNCTSPEVTTI